MAEPFSIDRLDIELTAAMDQSQHTPDPDTPFRALIIGDFSGPPNGRAAIQRTDDEPLGVDRDSVDDVIRRLGPEVGLDISATEPVRLTIRFSALDDFHPDRLFERLDVFRELRNLRRRLNDPDASRAAAAEVREWISKDVAPKLPSASSGRGPEPTEAEQVVRELLESGARRPVDRLKGDEDWHAFVRQIVAPHVVARDDPQRPELVAAVDRAAAMLMRAILHHPDFQDLEAAWRAVDFLVRRLETGTDLQLYLLDLSKQNLAAALAGGGAASRSIHRILVDSAIGTPGGIPWAVVAGNYTFDASAQDLVLLAAIGRIARDAGAPFLAAASPRVLGSKSLHETPDPDEWRGEDAYADRWQKLRTSLDANHLGLVLPRFLLRLPYGKNGERIDAFDFEELGQSPAHDHYLWGNPAFACVRLLGQAFSGDGWSFRAGAVQELDDLPLYVEQHDGERRVKPCAEALLTLRAAETILDRGLMPLLSFKDRDVVRLARFQSIRDPLTRLVGRWSG